MVFVLVNGKLYNTNSIRKLEPAGDGFDVVYAGHDKDRLTPEAMTAFLNQLEGKSLVLRPAMTTFLARE